MTAEQCDVLIIGAGPVGLLLALLLHAQGVAVKIVERQAALYSLPRAVAFDHESRRLFGAVGLSDGLNAILEEVVGEGGENGTNFVWRDKDLKLVADLYFEAPTRSGFPFASSFNQPQVETLLEQAVLDRKIPLIRGFALNALEQYPDHVEAAFETFRSKPASSGCADGVVVNGTLASDVVSSGSEGSDSGGEELRVSASYVVGCDGANSTVRRLQGFTVTDLSFENDWLIADLDGYIPPIVRRIGSAQICDPSRPTTVVFAGKGRRRFEFMRLPGESQEDLLKTEKLWELLEPWGFTKDNCMLERKVIYTFKARWANEFSRGRVALAGDSLHLMPPFIGQGLNSGFRDAGALAWRLPLILSGVANAAALLDSYQVERLEHIRKLTEYCISLGEVICETDADRSKALHAALRAAPPGRNYDPPLGKPGTLTDQAEAGHLSLQRPLRVGDERILFDKSNGYGWILLNYGDESVDRHLSGSARAFFDTLGGRCVSVSERQDEEGEYKRWFAEQLAPDHAVLVRPDFYVFGHASVAEVNTLIETLHAKMAPASL